jgi:phosphonate transport system substrate-binding protein
MILRHEIDASAIDSIVLKMEFQRCPGIRSKFRIIETLVPSPIPPLVVSRNLPIQLRETLIAKLTKMRANPFGQAGLAKGQLIRLAPVQDSDYDTIRHMYEKGSDVVLQPSPA